jgi:hypothetical protein
VVEEVSMHTSTLSVCRPVMDMLAVTSASLHERAVSLLVVQSVHAVEVDGSWDHCVLKCRCLVSAEQLGELQRWDGAT